MGAWYIFFLFDDYISGYIIVIVIVTDFNDILQYLKFLLFFDYFKNLFYHFFSIILLD